MHCEVFEVQKQTFLAEASHLSEQKALEAPGNFFTGKVTNV